MQDFVLEKLFLNVRDIKSCLEWEIIHNQLSPGAATPCFHLLIPNQRRCLPSKLPTALMPDQRTGQPDQYTSVLTAVLLTGGGEVRKSINVQAREESISYIRRNLMWLPGQDVMRVSGTHRVRARVKGFQC